MSTERKYCADCGAINDHDAIFCSSCGIRFEVSQSKLGQEESASSPSPVSTPVATPHSETMSSPAPQMDEEPIENLIDGTKKFVTSPQKNMLRLLADPNAPSSWIFVIIRVVLYSFAVYLQYMDDDYFNALGLINEADAANFDLTIEEARAMTSITSPIMLAILFLLIWWVGSWFMGKLISGDIHPQSPLSLDPSRAMRQLNGYRQLPLIVVNIISILLILTVEPQFYIDTMFFVRAAGQIVFAILLYRSLGQHVGYRGSWHKIIAFANLFLILFMIPV